MSNKENHEPEDGYAFGMDQTDYSFLYGSDEETEDAYETAMAKDERTYLQNKEIAYHDKLDDYRNELQMLHDRIHPAFREGEDELKEKYIHQQYLNKVFFSVEVARIKKEHELEREAAYKEFHEKEKQLRENLNADLEERKKIIEAERDNMDITSDSIEFLQNPIKKRRRRANDPPPAAEPKRKKGSSFLQLNLQLTDDEINEDLEKIIECTSESLNQVNDSSEGSLYENKISSDIRVENGKLYYEKYWYHRGQQIYYEEDGCKHSAVISTINPTEVWVKRTSDSEKYQIYISKLFKGIVTLKRRSA